MSIALKCYIQGVQGMTIAKGENNMSLFDILGSHVPAGTTPDQLLVCRPNDPTPLPVGLPLTLVHLNSGEVLNVSFKTGRPARKIRVKITSRHPSLIFPTKVATVLATDTLGKVLSDNVNITDVSNISVICMTRNIGPEMIPKTFISSLCGSSESLALVVVQNKGSDDVNISQKTLCVHPTEHNEEKREVPSSIPKCDEIMITAPPENKVSDEELMNNNDNNNNNTEENMNEKEVKQSSTKKYENVDTDPLSLFKKLKENNNNNNNNSNNTKLSNSTEKRQYIPPDEAFKASTPQHWDDGLIQSLVATAKAEHETTMNSGVPKLASIDPEKGDPFELTMQDLAVISIAKKQRPTASELASMSKDRKMGELRLKVTDTIHDNKETIISIKSMEKCSALYSLLTSDSSNEEIQENNSEIYVMTVHGWKLLPNTNTSLWDVGLQFNSRVVITKPDSININKFMSE